MSGKRPVEGSSWLTFEKNKKLRMESSLNETKFNSKYVIMPWDDTTEIIMSKGDSKTSICSRWKLIKKQLYGSAQITDVDELIKVIKSYNFVTEKDGRQLRPNWKCLVLQQYFAQLDEYNRKIFFQENGILSTIKNLSLQLQELVPKLKLLRTGSTGSITLHQLQIASILANAFLCTFPKGAADCPSINFNTLYEASSSSVLRNCVEKIKCIMHYFKRIHTRQPTGNLSFHRLCIPDHKFPRWDKTNMGLCSLRVDCQGRIEDQDGYLQMDFANRYVGGGVLGRGCVQEEIRFVVCPELIASRLFTECLADNESLFVIGAERYCQYAGYANTFVFAGDYQDLTPFTEDRHKKSYLIILDALYFNYSSEQYRENKILRELKKAYVGFKAHEKNCGLPLATGNWGCGAFGGDPQLKSILQLMASSEAQRDMLYLTFGDSTLKNQIQELYELLQEKAINVGMLYRIIRMYNREKRKNQSVFEFVKESLNNFEKSKSSPISSSCVASETSLSLDKNSVSSLSKEKTEEEYPELDIDFNILDKEIHSHSTPDAPINGLQFNSKISNSQKLEQSLSILDMIWFENELGSSSSTKQNSGRQLSTEKEKKEMKVLRNSPSLLSDEEVIDVTYKDKINASNLDKCDTVKSTSKKEKVNTKDIEEKTQRKVLVKETANKKLVQPKITELLRK